MRSILLFSAPILGIRTLVMSSAQGQIAGKLWRWVLNPGYLAPEPTLLTIMPCCLLLYYVANTQYAIAFKTAI